MGLCISAAPMAVTILALSDQRALGQVEGANKVVVPWRT
jgi:hypothetical protein